MATKLTVFNNSLILLGQPTLSALTDAVENRRLLDAVWDNNARDHCLEQGLWNFATRTVQIEYDTSVSSPDFGFQYAFSKPTDWIRTVALCSDEYFTNPMSDKDYVDEQGYWWAHVQTMFVRYVSNHADYGYDLSLWPQTFTRYVEAYLAETVAPRLSLAQDKLERLVKNTQRRLQDARSKDALNEGVKYPPVTGWVRARRGNTGYSGSRNQLIG